MFCLRTWIPILFFLTNVSPIYLILFVSATWYLNRPCLYCSLLLSILVISLYDWRSNWFEPRNNIWSSSERQSWAEMGQGTLVGDILNSTAASAAHAAYEGLSKRLVGEDKAIISGAQWLRELVGRKEWRIPCVNIAIRL